uniref:Uncharacterized protein n=1 Tax=Arion vulgaris TaxID=1028688 RepID=A0A0B7AA22_9EUPU
MASNNTTLTSLWIDDGQGSPRHATPVTPCKSVTVSNSKEDLIQFYRNTGLDSVAKDKFSWWLSLSHSLRTRCHHICYRNLPLLPR